VREDTKLFACVDESCILINHFSRQKLFFRPVNSANFEVKSFAKRAYVKKIEFKSGQRSLPALFLVHRKPSSPMALGKSNTFN
jgi:hypothetical protein